MTDYRSGQLSRTFGTIALSAMLASHALAAAPEVAEPNQKARLYRGYSSGAASRTYDQYVNVITGEYHTSSGFTDLEKTVSQVYARLLANQEPLGAAFEAVLHENLWDLYEG